MELHHLLMRQLGRVGLDHRKPPADLETWQGFLKSVNNAYVEADQERYLLERSMKISSRELLGLNEKRKEAEKEILLLHERLLALVRTTGEEETSVLHQRLLGLARSAGMADVATSILHNVGNILSSTNTSISLLEENISQPYYEKCFALLKRIKAHAPHLRAYLTEDPKGKLIPQYLAAIVDIIEIEHHELIREITNLKGYIQHIKDIIMKQQSLTGVSGFSEKINVSDLIDMALQISGLLDVNHIAINKIYTEMPIAILDKTKLLQILVNLINNAKDSVFAKPNNLYKQIDIELQRVSGDQLMIGVRDNGIGISSENRSKLFSFGFTTKKNGHGFGLHNSALVAVEMGGKLSAESEGINRGAIFRLTLPLKSPPKRSENA